MSESEISDREIIKIKESCDSRKLKQNCILTTNRQGLVRQYSSENPGTRVDLSSRSCWSDSAAIVVKVCSAHNLLPLRPWPLLVESVGIGVTSSILPILSPFLARALMADCAPGPGVFVSTPPIPRSLMWMALMPTSCNSLHTSTAASIAKTDI